MKLFSISTRVYTKEAEWATDEVLTLIIYDDEDDNESNDEK